MIDKILNANVEYFPYPYMVIDNFLNDEILNSIESFWPSGNQHNDLRGSNLFTFSDKLKTLHNEEHKFWQDFLSKDIHAISLCLAKKFKKYFLHKLRSSILEFGTGYAQTNVNIQNQKDFAAHTHFDHDPLWVVTFLIYISDLNQNSPGTSLYSVGESKNSQINNFLKWNDIWRVSDDKLTYEKKIKKIKDLNFKLIKTISFKKNRLFAFLDGPFSFHAVHYFKSNLPIIRKSIRFAIGIKRSEIENYYGINVENWSSFFSGKKNEELASILEREYNGYNPHFFSNIKNRFLSPKNLKLTEYPFF